jgi:D-arabinose 1-dehydrogenase-like Zn-dependent alcohol dehydrogenase
VAVAVEASGICYSDVHLLTDPAYGGTFPRIPGHEFVGRIFELGTDVTGLAVGERVGVPWAQRWCGRCRTCVHGLFSYCEAGSDVTGGTVDGGHAEVAIVDASAVEPVPDGIPSAEAAPLLCAGYTVYSALCAAQVRPGELVAVVGIGGLGHLAVQYALGMEASVVAVTRSADKEDALHELGVSEVVVAEGGASAALKALGGVDVIVHTANAIEPDLANGLRVGGRLAVAGVPAGRLAITPREMVFRRLAIFGASPGPRHLLRDLLRFHLAIGARTIVETYSLDHAADALGRVIDGSVRYRAVLTPRA